MYRRFGGQVQELKRWQRRASLATPLNILMITHHRRHKAFGRSFAMAKQLVRRGHSVTLVVIAEERRLGITVSDWDGVRTIETPDLLWGRLRSGWDPWDLINRIAYLAREKTPYDLIHCFETRPATIYPALYYSGRNQTTLLTDWNDWFGHGGLIDVLRPRWYRTLFGWLETYYEESFRSSAQGLTVISSALATRAKGLGVSQDRICQISGGTFPELFLSRTKEECRHKTGFGTTEPVIGYSSNDMHIDLDIVMAALAAVAERFPSVKLMITGKPGAQVLNLARSHGVEKNIALTGFLPMNELPWYLGTADVFVLPFPETAYNVGRWPNKIGDYMSLGRPTVSNPTGDIRTLFERHEIGLLSVWDPKDFAAKIVFLLEHPEVANSLGENARKTATKEFDWQILVRKLEEFYMKTIDTALVTQTCAGGRSSAHSSKELTARSHT